MSAHLFTIGFTRKGAARFFGLLADAGVRRVVDIRARPDSQLAGFARGPDLAWFLQKLHAIDYVALPALAPAKALLADYRDGRLCWDAYAVRYTGQLEAGAAAQAIEHLTLDHACLLCAEDDPCHCHRRLAAEWIAAHAPDLTVTHLR